MAVKQAELANGGLGGMADEHLDDAAAASAARIAQRVEAIRNGAPLSEDLREILAEMDHAEAELADEPFEDGEDDDPAGVEAAWADEIQLRVAEIRDGTAKTYDAEDVMTAMRLRFG